ncbi:MAG TPA: hypothetical protein VGI58_20940 [Streptosporangiaceae bacterium]
MSAIRFLPVLAITACLTAVAGCGAATSGGRPGAAARGASTSGAQQRATATASSSAGTAACAQAGSYLTAIRTGQHAGFDRVVFEFSGGLPSYQAVRALAVYTDPKGDEVPLPGQARLRLEFRGASAWCAPAGHATYAVPAALAPFYGQLLVVGAAGDFEQVLSFGIGMAATATFRVSTLTGPDRVVVDVRHAQLGKFPGIWDTVSWREYWQRQYDWLTGHQPWRSDPSSVVSAWARSRWHTVPAIQQAGPNDFRVTEPGGRVDAVTGIRPVSGPGPWVITGISYGVAPA